MTALSEALAASQSKALAALFKAYTRRGDDPDDDLFRAMMLKVGLDDEVQIGFLLAAWRIMRENPEALPAANGAAPAAPEVVDDQRWTSGKHKGVLLSETPEDYLRWAAESHPDPIARAASKAELERRESGVPF